MSETERRLRWMGPQTFLFVGLFVIAFTLAVLSFYWGDRMRVVIGPFQDCSWVHTLPGPPNCAGPSRMAEYENLRARSQISWAISIVFFIGSIFGLIFFFEARGRADTRVRSITFPESLSFSSACKDGSDRRPYLRRLCLRCRQILRACAV